jgi:hypothetical protein
MQVYFQSKLITVVAIPETTNQGTFDSTILTISKLTWLYGKTLCLFSIWLLGANANKDKFGALRI